MKSTYSEIFKSLSLPVWVPIRLQKKRRRGSRGSGVVYHNSCCHHRGWQLFYLFIFLNPDRNLTKNRLRIGSKFKNLSVFSGVVATTLILLVVKFKHEKCEYKSQVHRRTFDSIEISSSFKFIKLKTKWNAKH